jgi:2-(1,2-epoxy-1,2-dihydrophenyl)acetyl-CoA isomerase
VANELLSERRGQSLILTFNRPDRSNAMTFDMANQLFTLLKNVTTDRSVRAVLLCGADSNFMDGLDMNFYAGNIDAALERANHIILPYHSAIRELQTMEKPVLAAVEGFVTGSGMSLMLASDLVIAARSARFNCKFTDHALTPNGGCSYFLPRKVGLSRAVELMMLSEDFDAAEADRLHLVNRVVDDDKLQAEALAWLDRLAEGPTRAYGAIKKLCLRSFEQDMNAQLGLEHTYFGHSTRSFDFREAVKAHIAGTPSRFTGT